MTNKNSIPPCHNCICVPICKFKRYHDLYFHCILLREYLSWYLGQMNDGDYWSSPFSLIYDILKPTSWVVSHGGNVNQVTEEKK